MVKTQDRDWIQLATRLAAHGLGRTGSNPSVGCVIVRETADGLEVLGRGRTGDGGTPHGEINALAMAGQYARGATLYVTLEPCSHHGKTPPCVDAIISAGIGRVVIGVTDPNPKVAGEGVKRLKQAGIAVETGVLEDEAVWLTAGHILRITQNRPFVQMKIATGADGLIAPGDGEPVWVTGELARRRGHLLRAKADAIVVGIGTVLADDPSLDCRLQGLEAQARSVYVLDRHGRLPLTSKLVQRLTGGFTPPPTSPSQRKRYKVLLQRCRRLHNIVINAVTDYASAMGGSEEEGARINALQKSGVRVMHGVSCDEMFLSNLLDSMKNYDNVTRLLVEGGPHVWRRFLDAKLVDEVVHFSGPREVGALGLKPFVDEGLERLTSVDGFIEVDRRALGEDKMTVYRNAESMKAE